MKDVAKVFEAMKSGQPTVSVPEAGAVLGYGADAAYRQARAGIIPTIKIGRRRRVPSSKLLEILEGNG